MQLWCMWDFSKKNKNINAPSACLHVNESTFISVQVVFCIVYGNEELLHIVRVILASADT